MTDEMAVEHLVDLQRYCMSLADENAAWAADDMALDNAIKALQAKTDIKTRVNNLLGYIKGYENDCNVCANDTCRKCNDIFFEAVRDFIDDAFGDVMKEGANDQNTGSTGNREEIS